MKKVLGILGGMGPQATIDLQQKILNLTKAESDAEHLRVFIDNHPQIPDRIGAVLNNTTSPVPAMQESLNKLCTIGAECIIMPCISAHYFLKQLSIPPPVNFLDMLQISCQACSDNYANSTAGILCSEATAKSGLLDPYLKRLSIPYIYPKTEHQQLLSRLILGVKAQANLALLTADLHLIAEELQKRGADYFLLACTELPIIVQSEPLPYPYVDATKELAKAAILHCGYVLK
ncbi:MAG: amino acid racemase [Firmicutes bacterium]|nr:amino acid racemase [Bacillota bacterium]